MFTASPPRRDGPSYFARAATTVLVFALVVGPATAGAAVADSVAPTPSATTGITDSGTADDPDSNVTAHRGDVVVLPVDLANETSATVEVRRRGGDRVATLAVRDVDGDGRVSLRYNTYLGSSADAVAAVGPDEATVESTSGRTDPLPAATYLVTARADGTAVGEATLTLSPVPAPDVRVLTAPGGRGVADASTAAGVRRAIESGTLTRHPEVTPSAVVVVAVRAPGLSGALATTPGENATDRFATLAERDGFGFRLRENYSTVTASERPIGFSLRGAGSRVLAAPANDTYYAVFDVDRAPLTGDVSDHQDGYELGDEFHADVTVAPASGLVGDRRSAQTGAFEFVELDADLAAGGPVFVDPGPHQNVTAWTNLRPTSSVVVWVNATDGSFRKRRVATVEDVTGEPGIRTTFDFSGVPAGAEFTVAVTHRNETLTRREGEVLGEDFALGIVNATWDSSPAVTANVSLPRAGFVVLHRGSADGPVVGESGYLPPGSHPDVTVSTWARLGEGERVVAVVHRDAVDDQQFVRDQDPPVSDGSYVADSVVRPSRDRSNVTETPSSSTPGPNVTSTSSPTATRSPATARTTPTAATASSPGPGIGLALLAVLLAGLVAARR